MTRVYHKHHVIKFVNGKRVRTNKLISLTIKEHAEEHKRLYEKYGHWKDKVAYQGLSGMIDRDEIIYLTQALPNIGNKHAAGREVPKKQREYYRKILTGRKHTEEARQKIIQGLIGRPVSKSTRLKMSKSYRVTKDGKSWIIKNLREFCRDNNLHRSAIYGVLSGERRHHKGYVLSLINRSVDNR